MKTKVWGYSARGNDGMTYEVQVLATDQHLAGLQSAGILPQVMLEVVGMQDVADEKVDELRRSVMLPHGGMPQ